MGVTRKELAEATTGEPLRGVTVHDDRIEGVVARSARPGGSDAEIRVAGVGVSPSGAPWVHVERAHVVVRPRSG